MNKNKIGLSVHYIPLHKHSFYKKKYKIKNFNLEKTDKYFKECVSLPIYEDLKLKQIKYITDNIKMILINYIKN